MFLFCVRAGHNSYSFNNLCLYKPLILSLPWNTFRFTWNCVSQIAIPKTPNKTVFSLKKKIIPPSHPLFELYTVYPSVTLASSIDNLI